MGKKSRAGGCPESRSPKPKNPRPVRALEGGGQSPKDEGQAGLEERGGAKGTSKPVPLARSEGPAGGTTEVPSLGPPGGFYRPFAPPVGPMARPTPGEVPGRALAAFRLGQLDRVAPEEAVRRAIQPDARLAAGPLHSRPAGRDAPGFPRVVGQLGVGPVGPVEPLTGRPGDHPAADFLGHLSRDHRGVPLGLSRIQAFKAPIEVGVEPPLDGTGRDPEGRRQCPGACGAGGPVG